MPKAEISWKRRTEEGDKLQVYAQRVGGEWIFYQREKRFDQWQPVPDPPLEDWMELLDAVQAQLLRGAALLLDDILWRLLVRFHGPPTLPAGLS
jgi:hypothetical protein